MHMCALIRLGACVCNVLREHMSTVFCKPVCSVCYENMRVFMHPRIQVCVGGTCVCAFTQTLPVCMCAHTYTYTREYLHVCVAGVYTCARWCTVHPVSVCIVCACMCVSMYTCALVCT